MSLNQNLQQVKNWFMWENVVPLLLTAIRDGGAGRTSRLSDNSDLAAYCSNIQMLQCESTYRSPPLYCRKYNHILLETLNVMEIR